MAVYQYCENERLISKENVPQKSATSGQLLPPLKEKFLNWKFTAKKYGCRGDVSCRHCAEAEYQGESDGRMFFFKNLKVFIFFQKLY